MHPLEREMRELAKDERIFDFFEDALDGLWIWDLTEDGVSWVTPAMARMIGYEPGDFEQGASFWESVMSPEDWQGAMDATQRAIATDGRYDRIARMKHKDGHTVWCRTVGVILYDGEGQAYRGFGIQHDITELMEAKEKLEREIRHDPLTGLLNRKGIDDALKRTLEQVQRLQCHAYAMILDLDDFKQVNDRYGHATGDDVLTQTADTLSRAVRVVDEVGRLGGDEFIIFLLARDHEEAECVVDRVENAIRHQIVESAGEEVEVTVSAALLPICCVDGVRIDRIATLLRAATPYLKRAKQNGKDRVASPTLRAPVAD